MNIIRPVLFGLPLAFAVAACGSSGDSHTANDGTGRTVNVTMRDIDFDPAALSVTRGETVTFVFTNNGALRHDAFVGNEMAQLEHEQQMSSGGDAGHAGHGDAITVDPGKSGELTHTFDQSGVTYIGCHETGHYDAGMRIRVTVT